MAVVKQQPNFGDINLRFSGHPKYKTNKVIEDDVIEVILQKLEMILYTKRGDVLGAPNMGCDLEYYLWSTKLSNSNLEQLISDQINTYIPELNTMGYKLELNLFEGELRDILELNFTIKGYNVYFIWQ